MHRMFAWVVSLKHGEHTMPKVVTVSFKDAAILSYLSSRYRCGGMTAEELKKWTEGMSGKALKLAKELVKG